MVCASTVRRLCVAMSVVEQLVTVVSHSNHPFLAADFANRSRQLPFHLPKSADASSWSKWEDSTLFRHSFLWDASITSCCTVNVGLWLELLVKRLFLSTASAALCGTLQSCSKCKFQRSRTLSCHVVRVHRRHELQHVSGHVLRPSEPRCSCGSRDAGSRGNPYPDVECYQIQPL